MKTINSIEEAIRLFEENSIKQAQTMETGTHRSRPRVQYRIEFDEKWEKVSVYNNIKP